VLHWLRAEGAATGLYDVVTLADMVRPKCLGFKTDEIRRVLRIEDEQTL